MKVLIIDLDGLALAFALECVGARHTVRYFLKPADYINPKIGDGFKGIERVTNWVGSATWADLVWISGNYDFMAKLEFFRDKGVAVFGPSVKSANLEIKRAEGMRFFEDHDIEVPEFQQFKTLADAEAHVRKTPDRYVFKTLGDEEDKSLSYVGKSPADMIARIERWQRLGMNPKGPVMLQKFIPGIEFAVSRFVGSEGFIGQYNENFEHKKLLSGNCGPNCGEAGTVMKYVDKSKIGDEVLGPLEDSLVEMGHLGDVDVNCIIDEKGQAWPLEFTTRPGWPAHNVMLREHRGDPIQWMLDACHGEDTLEVSTDVAVGIVVAQPDYPYSERDWKETEDIPIYGVSPKNQKYLKPQHVKMATLPDMNGEGIVERPMWATAGDYVAVATGMGGTVKQACKRAYDVISDIDIPDMIYRDDIGEKLEEELPKLHAHGYAKEFNYT